MKKICLLASCATLWIVCGCSDGIPMVNLGIDGTYSVYRMRTLRLHPEFEGTAYRWTMTDSKGCDSLVSVDRDYYFCAASPGVYTVRLDIDSPTDPVTHTVSIKVWEEDVAYSRYIDRVLEYRPAPGQFINELPKYETGDTEADMCRKATEAISGKNDVLISLGNYGGYVTFAFDHTVVNIEGEYDFKIHGNSFYSASNPNPSVTAPGGSAEPGIVMVAVDCNGNGLPDDPWYELAGSEYHRPTTLKNFSLTYYRPDRTMCRNGKTRQSPTLPTYVISGRTVRPDMWRKTHIIHRTTGLCGSIPIGSHSPERCSLQTASTRAIKATIMCSTVTHGDMWTITPTT